MKQAKTFFIFIAATLCLSATGREAGTTASGTDLFLWNQANAAMASAEETSDFASAARLYRELIGRGARSAELYGNYGTALLLADEPAAALDAFLRAERRSGTTPDLRHNIMLAMSAMRNPSGDHSDLIMAELPWTRLPLFWHYQIPLHSRIGITLFLFNMLWLAGFLRILRLKDTARGLAVASVVGLVLFGSSSLVSLHREARPLPELSAAEDARSN